MMQLKQMKMKSSGMKMKLKKSSIFENDLKNNIFIGPESDEILPFVFNNAK